jgi:glycosyltransferase involved in cell wall biosynthesis
VVTSVFPASSEAFAGVEVRALEAAGARLRIRAMRSSGPHARRLLDELNLTRTDVSHADFASLLRGMAFGVAHPVMAIRSVAWLLRYGWRTPGLMMRCMLFMPRFFDIFSECLSRPPDVLHLYWGHYPAIVGFLARRFLRRIHLSVSLTAFDLVYEFGPGLRIAEEADSLWTHANSNLAMIRGLGVANPRLHVLVRGLDLSEVPGDSRLHAKHRGLMVTVSRLVKNKGVDDAIRVLAGARRVHGSLSLEIIGEGPERGNLEALARKLGVGDAVKFLGSLSHADVYERLVTADMLLLMSRNPSERLPNAVKEAMACRCICVITESPGIEQLVGPLTHKLIVRQRDWEHGARLVSNVVENSSLYEADRDTGRQYMLSAYDASRIAAARLAVWTACAPQERGGRN